MFNYCLIMAAGNGKRFGQVTLNLPKALVEIQGRPLISYSLDQVQQQVGQSIVTIGHNGDKLLTYLYANNVQNIIDTNGKGNSWWIFNTIVKHINEPILVLPCDLITVLDLNFIFKSYSECGFPLCMVVPVNPIDGIMGDFIFGSDNKVSKLARNEKSDIYCSGIQVINPYLINKHIQPNEDFYQVWNELIGINQLTYSPIYPYDWQTIDNLEQLKKYSEIIQQ